MTAHYQLPENLMPNSKPARPTMLDVARLSGVSYQTVSRVINDHPYVSKKPPARPGGH